MSDNLGGNVAESVAAAIVNDYRAADITSIILNLGRAGFSINAPDFVFTVFQCFAQA